jgi:hypothetical protein
MKLGLMLHDPEEEHDCFSDNTHNSHFYDEVGMMNIYYGRYTRLDGAKVGGVGIAEYVKAKAPAEGQRLTADMDATLAALKVIKDTADSGRMAYDQMIGPDNPEGNKMIDTAVELTGAAYGALGRGGGRRARAQNQARGLRQPRQSVGGQDPVGEAGIGRVRGRRDHRHTHAAGARRVVLGGGLAIAGGLAGIPLGGAATPPSSRSSLRRGPSG